MAKNIDISQERQKSIFSLCSVYRTKKDGFYREYNFIAIEYFNWLDKINVLQAKQIDLPPEWNNFHIGSNVILIVGQREIVQFRPELDKNPRYTEYYVVGSYATPIDTRVQIW